MQDNDVYFNILYILFYAFILHNKYIDKSVVLKAK